MMIKEYQQIICEIAERGPIESDYGVLQNFFRDVNENRAKGVINENDIIEFRKWFGDTMETDKTLQGHVCLKPFGYNGDFKIIDKIYTFHTSENSIYAKWDNFFHSGDAPKAVRNRKDYFISKLMSLKENSSVLNLASGPCRDLLEFQHKSNKTLIVDCVDMDEKAIEYGKRLLENTDNITFSKANVFKYKPTRKYDLIWSAGLFDYFNDKAFTIILKRLTQFLNPNGKIIIGNFNTGIDSQDYMEFGNWHLNYRNENRLLQLGKQLDAKFCTIESESLNVNLFLNLKF